VLTCGIIHSFTPPSRTKQTPKERERYRNPQAECCTKKEKRPPPTYQNPQPVTKYNFFTPLRDLPTENWEPGGQGK
jgi:hypothetical protein